MGKTAELMKAKLAQQQSKNQEEGSLESIDEIEDENMPKLTPVKEKKIPMDILRAMYVMLEGKTSQKMRKMNAQGLKQSLIAKLKGVDSIEEE